MADKPLGPLELLQQALVKELLDRITAGKATAADLGVARALLRDNGIQVLPEASDDFSRLCEQVPFRPSAERAS